MYNANKHELEILEFWDKIQAFEKSVSERPENKPYVFYDGPPFATGLPHYGHILSSVIKDVVPRYWTMKGFSVRRRWGWDCHGLPIESLIERELKISGKKEIEKLGVDTFNNACGSRVLEYTQEWKKMVRREGRWVEFDNAYKTMDSTYMESVWWALKMIWDNGLIYEGRKVLMYCPRCETPVSKAEVTMDNSYKDVTEEAVTVKFKVRVGCEVAARLGLPENTYILAWTTTPWTLPGNVALAVGAKLMYSLVKVGEYNYLVAKDRLMAMFADKEFELLDDLKGIELVGLTYEPLYELKDVSETGKRAWYVASADFVTTEEGTGIVHTAVMYGEDDYNLGLQIDLPIVPLLNETGHFNDAAPDFIQGQYFKKSEKFIKDDLEKRDLLFRKEQHTHNYPHCWRCDTQLFYNAISAWFINIQKIKSRLIELNEKINWFPEHLKHGRFLNILETAPDWNISRNRYWATPLPFWKCVAENCRGLVCVGSVAELKQLSLNFGEVFKSENTQEIDLHKHFVDRVLLKCEMCGSEMRRVPEVIDCWVESASMPFAEFHYPFENREVFEARFPGNYIAEYIAQTRAWFYYMHVMATVLFDNISFENVVCTGTILNEKGEKLSKSKQNFTDPWIIIETYGVDALRYYLMTSVVMQSENLLFNEREVRDAYNRVVNLLWNVAEFYELFADESSNESTAQVTVATHVLDRWILARLHELVGEVTVHMDAYDTVKAGRPIKDFIADLSTWYVRRSRDRFKDTHESFATLSTLNEVLLTLSKVMAPFTPFISEIIYQKLKSRAQIHGEGAKSVSEWPDSVHLCAWPVSDESLIDSALLLDMARARKVVELGLAIRAEAGIKVRQVLSELIISQDLPEEYLPVIADELNVKYVRVGLANSDSQIEKRDGELTVVLNTELTDELRQEGLLRELVRTVNELRKQKGLTVKDSVILKYQSDDPVIKEVFEKFGNELKKAVLASELAFSSELVDGDDIEVDGRSVRLCVTK